MPKNAVTLKDVATLAGVSRSTVSKVLNGGGRVSEATRIRVRETAERLDFRPNALAQFLATGKSRTIGFLSEHASGIFARSMLQGAVTELGKHDMAALVYDAHHENATLLENVRKLRARKIDGLIVIGDELAVPLRSVSSGFDCPVVYVRSRSDSPLDVSFLPDSEMASRLAAEHLISLGRTRIAHINNLDSISGRLRTEAFRVALAKAGLTMVGGEPLRSGWTREAGTLAARRMLELGEVDAVYAGNDQQALAAIDVLESAGRRVPEDVAVVGVDNFEALAALESRTLTTIDLNHTALGAAAAAYIVQPDPGLAGVQLQPCSLVLGRSTMGSAVPPVTGALEPG